MRKFDVEAYVDQSGRCRFEEWYRSLREKLARVAVQRRVTRLEGGNFGDCKSLGEALFELRINFGPGYRVYFTVRSGRVVLLLVGGDKRTQSKDIRVARKLVRELKDGSYETKKYKS